MARPRSENPSARALYSREWNAKNREKAREYALKYKRKNLEQVRKANTEAKRKERERDPVPSREAAKRWRERHPERAATGIQASKAKNPDKYRAIANRASHRYRERYPEKGMLKALKRSCAVAGITLEQYERERKAQDDKCAICRKAQEGRRLYVDHCHGTGRFRGLLCRKCNAGLGHFEDDPEALRDAAQYIQERKGD